MTGYTKYINAGGSVETFHVDFKAVNASTFAQTAIWSQQDSTQSLGDLMGQLRSQRTLAASRKVVPALAIMVRSVSRPVISQVLRLNED